MHPRAIECLLEGHHLEADKDELFQVTRKHARS